MPNSAITQRSIKQLIFAWISAFSIIIFLLTSAQGFIQYTEIQEIHARNVSAIINRHELRTQLLFRLSLILLTQGTHKKEISEMAAVYPLWVNTAESLYGRSTSINISPSDFDSNERIALDKVQDDYKQVSQAVSNILRLEKMHPTVKQLVPDITTIFYHADTYLTVLVDVYTAKDGIANAYSVEFRVIEIVIYALTLLVMTAEATFVVRPALKHMRDHFKLLAEMMEKEKKLQPSE